MVADDKMTLCFRRHNIVNSMTISDGDFDRSKATVDNIYSYFVLTVPFRFRVPNLYHCHFESQGNGYDIWIQNQPVPTYDSDPSLPDLKSLCGKLDVLFSTVAIIPNKGVRITDDVLDATLDALSKDKPEYFGPLDKQLFLVVQALNTFIVGYHTSTGELYGGQPLLPLTMFEFMRRMKSKHISDGIQLAYFTPETAGSLFDIKADKLPFPICGDLTDLSQEKLAGIETAIDRLNQFYFYDLAFEAKAKMEMFDYKGALLMAVAALEGVHGAYVSHILSDRLPAGRTGDDKKLEEDFLRELGFSRCNSLTPYLFMEESERPTPDLIKQAAKAVLYRNEIMHVLRNSAGDYRIRTRTDFDLHDAYTAALKMYDLYRTQFEKLISGAGSR
jgi:hypothetical protein